jgi:polysaccharide export outer membrane protein
MDKEVTRAERQPRRRCRARSIGDPGSIGDLARSILLGPLVISAALCFATAAGALPLSPGDRLKITIPEGEEFSGLFEVNIDGRLEIPYLQPISVVGLEPAQAQRTLRQALISAGLFQPSYLKVALNVVQWAPVEVFVSGETFVPGRVLVNELTPSETTQPPVPITGQYPPNRFLSTSLKQAGGITPKADVTAIRLTRAGRTTVHDLSGILTGTPFADVPLVAGDRIEVPSTGRVDPDLVRVSQITPSGVKIFLSNLTVPSSSNASSGISRDATSFSYGSRFSHAVVAANCAGGTRLTNAGRTAVLVRVDQRSGTTRFLERKVNSLLLGANDDRNNPYLMANDAVACFDSPFTTVRDMLNAIGEFITPVGLVLNLIP